ncbi:MAG: transporter substrate-binding domain-containing protein [Pseudomonadota bacterium]
MRNSTLACVLGAATLGGAVFASSPVEAQTLACGGTYTIQRGDTLQKVTRMAYGDGLSFNFLYRANRDVVGPNPSLIEVGMVLQVPCRDGQTAGAAAPAPTTTSASTGSAGSTTGTGTVTGESGAASNVTQASASGGGFGVSGLRGGDKIRMITGTDWAPFANEDQEQGGMITEIINVAAETMMQQSEFQVDFINDWGAHMEPLIADGAYDFTFPWFRPNCDAIDKLGPTSVFRCEQLAWSDPLFEQIIGYYMRADDTNKPTDHVGLFGRTVCRPSGYATFMLEENDLVEPNITLMRPGSPTDCFAMLASGEVDAVVIATMVGDDAIANIPDASNIEEQPQLSTIATMHAATSVDNPDKDAQLAVLNEGIANVRESGKWFEIVQRHLVAHARRTSN